MMSYRLVTRKGYRGLPKKELVLIRIKLKSSFFREDYGFGYRLK